MKIYLIAGEASGDLHGSNLIRELRRQSPQTELRCWGGDLMQAAGATLVKHYRDLAFMGFVEVLLNLRTIARNLRFCREDILRFQPDALVLIDYPGFNLRIAKWAKSKNIRVFYYISPQIWAWNQGRVKLIQQYVDDMFVVLPFEQAFYQKHGCAVHFVGHPLLDAMDTKTGTEEHRRDFYQAHSLTDKPIVALLPGSRRQEIKTMLPVMLSVADDFPDYQFVVAGAPGQSELFYRHLMSGKKIPLLFGATYPLFQYAAAGLVTSGTATLEAGIFNMPQVVCYKGNFLSYLIARRLIKVKFISLVNLVLDKKAVPELIQRDFTRQKISVALKLLLTPSAEKETMMRDYTQLHTLLGGPGASRITASLMLKNIENRLH